MDKENMSATDPCITESGDMASWPQTAIDGLAKLPPEELIAKLAEALRWYVRSDDVILGMPGNEPWISGYYRGQALVKAYEQAAVSGAVKALPVWTD